MGSGGDAACRNAGPVSARIGDREEDAETGQKSDRHESSPELLEVKRERGLEDQAGHEREQDQVGPDRGQSKARHQADQDPADGQEHGVRDDRSLPGDESQPGRGCAKEDEEEQKALRGAHGGGRTPPADQPSRHTIEIRRLARAAREFYFLGGRILATQ